MIVKIVGLEGTRLFECARVLTGGYTGGSNQETTRDLFLESNEDGGSVSVAFTKGDNVYVLNNEGRTIDRIYF
jgi:hypothetical protein